MALAVRGLVRVLRAPPTMTPCRTACGACRERQAEAPLVSVQHSDAARSHVLGGDRLGRVAYLRHMAEFHRREAERWSLQLKGPILRGRNDDLATREFDYHGQRWLDYSDAVYRPWTLVWEPPEPTP